MKYSTSENTIQCDKCGVTIEKRKKYTIRKDNSINCLACVMEEEIKRINSKPIIKAVTRYVMIQNV